MAGINDGYSSQLFSGLLAARGINSAQINGGIQAAIAGQNSANKANEQRYQQGLSTLQGGSDKAAGLLQSATNQIANNGQAGYNRIGLQEQQGIGNATQSAVSRGLSDTTIQDSLQRGVSRDANDARLALGESINRQQAAAKEAQASQASQGAGSISNWIGQRTDAGPNMGLLAQMIETASSNPATQRTAQINRPSVPGLGGSAGNNGLPSNFGGGAAANGGGYNMGPNGVATPYGQQSANFASSFGNAGGGTPGGGSPTYFANGGTAQAGPVQSALTPGADQTVSSALMGDSSTNPGTNNLDLAAAQAALSATGKGSLPLQDDPNKTFASSPYEQFTKSQWEALTTDQKRNVSAGRRQNDNGA